MQEKIAKLNQKIDELQAKAAENAAIMDAKKDASREQVEIEIGNARSRVEQAKDRVNANIENVKTAAAAEVSKIQAGIDNAKQKIADKKEAIDQRRFERYIEDTVEYADSCVEIALFAIEEAKLAALEAVAAQIEYNEKYGN